MSLEGTRPDDFNYHNKPKKTPTNPKQSRPISSIAYSIPPNTDHRLPAQVHPVGSRITLTAALKGLPVCRAKRGIA